MGGLERARGRSADRPGRPATSSTIGDDGGVRAGPAIRGADLAPALAARGRIFPGGHCPTVGIGGFLLQGGQGWNCRGWGWGAQYVEAIDVVSPTASCAMPRRPTTAELLWAARGAGPGYFGVVTRFHLRTRPAPRAMVQSTYAYPAERSTRSCRGSRPRSGRSTRSSRSSRWAQPALLHDGPAAARAGRGLTDTPEAGRAALAPLERARLDAALVARGRADIDREQFVDQYRANPEDHRYGVDNAWLSVPDEVSVPLLRDAFTELPNAKSFSLWYSQAPLHRAARHGVLAAVADLLRLLRRVGGRRRRRSHRGWLAEVFAEWSRIADGAYLGDSDFQVRPARFMAEDNWRAAAGAARPLGPRRPVLLLPRGSGAWLTGWPGASSS